MNVAAGATSASFKVKKSDASSFEGDEKINFQITYVNGGLSIGDKRALVLSFGEIVAVSATVDVNGAEQLILTVCSSTLAQTVRRR
ncbi:MAG: hypothetical protein WDO15_23890 [Bacteroidota bacterium]